MSSFLLFSVKHVSWYMGVYVIILVVFSQTCIMVYGCVCHHSCCFQSNMYHGIWVCMSSFLLFSVKHVSWYMGVYVIILVVFSQTCIMVYGCVCHHSCCFQSNMYHGIWVCMSSFLLFSVKHVSWYMGVYVIILVVFSQTCIMVYGCVCHHSCCFQSNMYHGIWVCMSSFLLFSVKHVSWYMDVYVIILVVFSQTCIMVYGCVPVCHHSCCFQSNMYHGIWMCMSSFLLFSVKHVSWYMDVYVIILVVFSQTCIMVYGCVCHHSCCFQSNMYHGIWVCMSSFLLFSVKHVSWYMGVYVIILVVFSQTCIMVYGCVCHHSCCFQSNMYHGIWMCMSSFLLFSVKHVSWYMGVYVIILVVFSQTCIMVYGCVCHHSCCFQSNMYHGIWVCMSSFLLFSVKHVSWYMDVYVIILVVFSQTCIMVYGCVCHHSCCFQSLDINKHNVF